jgi:hypothetical protein
MGKVIDILMEQRTLSLQVAILLFLISFLINLLQRRFSRTRMDRILRKEEMIVTFLRGIHKKLGKLERNCTLELHGASSPQEVGKAIDETRNKIQSTIDGLEEHLRSFHHYRREEKSQEKQRKQLQKSHQKLSGG